MRKRFFFWLLMIAVLAGAIPAFAEEDLLFSNFNNAPVKNTPEPQ